MYFFRCLLYVILTLLKIPLFLLRIIRILFMLTGMFLVFAGVFFWLTGWEWNYLLIGVFLNAGVCFAIPFVVEFLYGSLDYIRSYMRGSETKRTRYQEMNGSGYDYIPYNEFEMH